MIDGTTGHPSFRESDGEMYTILCEEAQEVCIRAARESMRREGVV